MEEKSILEKISSKYIFEGIFNYINNQNFKMKLLCYSKALQKKININIIDYIAGINPNEYLAIYNYKSLNGKFNKNNVISKLNEKLNEKYGVDINIIKLYIIYIFKKNIKKLKENNNNYKDIKKENTHEII